MFIHIDLFNFLETNAANRRVKKGLPGLMIVPSLLGELRYKKAAAPITINNNMNKTPKLLIITVAGFNFLSKQQNPQVFQSKSPQQQSFVSVSKIQKALKSTRKSAEITRQKLAQSPNASIHTTIIQHHKLNRRSKHMEIK